MATDVEQQLSGIVGGGSGIFYTVASDGTLSWWRHLGQADGAVWWANNGAPRVIGSGFNNYVTVAGGHDGTLYGITGDGVVRRFRWIASDLNTGAGSWESPAGVIVATGWNRYARVWGGPDNVLWATDLAGNLYRSQLTNGQLPTPQKVGNGWNSVGWVGADGGGVVYGLKGGDLFWWRWVNGAWVNGGAPIRIGNGWAEAPNRVFCPAGNGLFYWIGLADSATGRDQDLWWIRLTNPLTVAADGGPRWANNGSPRKVGSGFTCEQTSRMQGYCWPQSAGPGQTVGVKVSTSYGSMLASVLRVAPDPAPVTVIADHVINTGMQLLQSGYRQNGTGWADTATVDIPADGWPPGLYVARVTSWAGERHDLPFVVRPASPAAPLALILPTLTYHAYNIWGGRSQYTNAPTAGQRTLSMQRPSYVWTVEPSGGIDCHGYSDVLLARWLAGQGYQVDVYTDLDVHANPGLLSGYRGVILGTHPEYCTDEMRQAYACYTNSGGRLVYPGGNGLYERVTVAGGHQVTYRRPDGGRDLYAERGQPASQILGVDYVADGWGTQAPYKVVADHPVLAGTGLTVGSVFGATGVNGPASAIEFDMAPAGGTAQLIAVGQNTPTLGAHMTWADKPNGGFVFSASSLTFPGALGNDQAAGQILRNVLDRAIA